MCEEHIIFNLKIDFLLLLRIFLSIYVAYKITINQGFS